MTHDLIISRTKKIFEKKINTSFVFIGQWLIEDFKKEEIENHKIQINKPASFEQIDRKKYDSRRKLEDYLEMKKLESEFNDY